MIKQDQHLLFADVKEKWETGDDTKELAAAAGQKGKVADVTVSNLMFYTHPTDLGWGQVRSVYCAVSVAVPYCANVMLLFQACGGKLSYTLVHCPGIHNEETAQDYMDAFVDLIENSHSGNATL